MSGAWWENLGAGVDRLIGEVTDVAWSADGALLAAHRPRGAQRDLARRERLWCVDDATGEATSHLDGPDNLRAFAWVDAEHLAVLRDAKGGVRITLHAMPDGGVVAERFLPGAREWRARFAVFPDGRRLFVRPLWNGWERPAPPCVVLTLPDLAPHATIAAPEGARATEVSVDDDADRWAMVARFGDDSTRIVTGRCGDDRVEVRALPRDPHLYPSDVRWIGRGELAVIETSFGRGARISVSADGGPLRETFAWSIDPPLSDWDGDGDDDFVAMETTRERALPWRATFLLVRRENAEGSALLRVDARTGDTSILPLPAALDAFDGSAAHDLGDRALALVGGGAPRGVVPGLYLVGGDAPALVHRWPELGWRVRLIPLQRNRFALLSQRADAWALRRVMGP